MRRYLLLVLLLTFFLTNFNGLSCAAAADAKRPNIVLIFADDLGWQDTGFTGSDFYQTPNLDRLAKDGMVFRQAYSSAGNCQPSRACLISGQYTPRHGTYAVGTTNRGPKTAMRMEPVPNKDGPEPTDFALPKALKSAGYVTGCFGKWHLEGPTGATQQQLGFDVVFKGNKKASADVDPKGVYSLTEAACAFIETNKDRPFFLYLPHHAVHGPIEARKETIEKFKALDTGKTHNPNFAASIAELDNGVGILLKKLSDLKLDQNTLVLFTSDNGGTSTSQEPLRGAKGAYYEGGIREPMIVRWPTVVKPGSTCNVPVINVDFYPTFAAVAGASLPTDRPLDGTSLVPLLEGKPSLDRQSIFWHFPGYLDGPVPRGRDKVFRTRPVSVIHKGDWKLFLYHEEWQLDGGKEKLATNHAVELYNLADDPGEHKDLASSNTAKRDELVADLEAWFKHTGAKLPTKQNPDYQADSKEAPKQKKKARKAAKNAE